MRKIIFLLFITLVIISVSCTKKHGNITEIKTEKAVKKTRKIKPTGTQHFEKAILDCMTPAGNCATTVIIRPHLASFKQLDNATTLGYTSVVSFFNTPEGKELIIEYFGDEYVDKLQSGNYTVISAYNSTTSTRFYLLGKSSSLTLDNAEFVIPTTIN